MKKFSRWIKKHYRIILAIDAVIIVGAAAFIFAVEKPEDVEGLEITDTTFSTATLSWGESENAKSYSVYRSEDGKDYEYVGNTTETSYTDEDLRTGTTYYYKVAAKNIFKSSDMDTDEAPAAQPSLDTPELKVDVSEGEMKLSYSEIAGAIGYEIFKDGEVIGQSEDTDYVDENVDGEQHEYSVKAYRYKKDPVYSEESNSVEVEMQVLDGFNIELFEGDMYITWTGSDFYTNFKVYDGGAVVAETSDRKCQINEYAKETEYDIKVVGYNSDGTVQSNDIGRKFMIVEEEMSNQDAIDAAVAWGIHIANDNSFTYGVGKRSHRFGCYFCQTNVGPRKNMKGKSKVNGHSYEKTYCCNPFVHACYAHGAGDPAMLKACRSAHGISMTKRSFTRYGHWKSVGKVSRGNLKKGDVLVRSNHVMMYIGNGQIVHAAGGGWDAGSITVTSLGGRSYSFVMRYTGTGRGTKDVIRDVDEAGNLVDENGNIIIATQKEEVQSTDAQTQDGTAAEETSKEEAKKEDSAAQDTNTEETKKEDSKKESSKTDKTGSG